MFPEAVGERASGAHLQFLSDPGKLADLQDYLKLRGLKLGFVLNFGANLMKDGIERVVNGLPEESLGGLAALRDTPI